MSALVMLGKAALYASKERELEAAFKGAANAPLTTVSSTSVPWCLGKRKVFFAVDSQTIDGGEGAGFRTTIHDLKHTADSR